MITLLSYFIPTQDICVLSQNHIYYTVIIYMITLHLIIHDIYTELSFIATIHAH